MASKLEAGSNNDEIFHEKLLEVFLVEFSCVGVLLNT